jgi:hypothetical protein
LGSGGCLLIDGNLYAVNLIAFIAQSFLRSLLKSLFARVLGEITMAANDLFPALDPHQPL